MFLHHVSEIHPNGKFGSLQGRLLQIITPYHEYAHLAFLWKSSVLLRRGNLIFHHLVIGSCVFLSGSQLGLRVSEG